MRVAIIGSGISGLTAAWLLKSQHAVTLFEANDYLGGHTHTVSVYVDGQHIDVDTGFIVYNENTYPNFIGLLSELGVNSVETSMGFSVRDDRTGLEYNGTDLNGLFSQRRNLIQPRFYRMLRDILRFNQIAPRHLDGREDETVGEFLKTHCFSREFSDQYLLPMGAAIWSCPMQTFEQFPIRFIIEFYQNHGLLQIFDRPIWRTIPGGARRYVNRIAQELSDIRLATPVQEIQRRPDSIEVTTLHDKECFDEVILACHSDQALRMLVDPDEVESEILQQFPYSKNLAILHTDRSVLPSHERAWASWNYHIRQEDTTRPSVTYNMNILQHLSTTEPLCVTLNEEESIKPTKILGTYQYSHPIFTTNRSFAQQRHRELIRRKRVSCCGAYWGNGFHEDGVKSAIAVCRAFEITPPWQQSPGQSTGQEQPLAGGMT